MDDWAPVLEIPETDDPVTETFDPTWPYNLKWSYNGETKQIHVWRTMGGSIDGRPYHRAEAERLWGRQPRVRGDQPNHDILGLAVYTPAERKLNGDVVAPPAVLVQSYYGQQPPVQLADWFEAHFPGVAVRRAKLAGNGPTSWQPEMANDDPVIKWVWSQADGTLVWEADADGLPTHDQKIESNWQRVRNPKDILGFAVPDGATIEIEPAKGVVPPQAAQVVKQTLAELYPNSDILLPDAAANSYGVEIQNDPKLYMRDTTAATFMRSQVGDTPETPLQAPESASKASDWGKTATSPPLLVRAMRKVMGLPVESATGPDMDGAMVAIFIPKEVGKKIKVKGGETVENMHVTLAFFEEKADERDDWSEVERIVEQIAKQHPPLKGTIGGVGVFQNGEDGSILWASPNIPGLAELRDDIVEAIEDAGIPLSKEHGWTPHITLKYEFEGDVPRLKNHDLNINCLTFARGEDKQDFKFEGSFEKEAADWQPQINEWYGVHPESGQEQEYGPQTWSGWQGASRFVTDGKNVITEPEESLRAGGMGWHGNGHEPMEREFKLRWPDTDGLTSGWIVPTKDGLGHGIFAPSLGFGLYGKEPEMHDVMRALDKETGKPTHFIDETHMSNPDIYRVYPEGGNLVGHTS